MKLEFSRHFFSKNNRISNFVKIRPVGAEVFHADGRKDSTKLTVASRNFVNVLKNICCISVVITSKATYILALLTDTFKNTKTVYSSSVVYFQRTSVTPTLDASVGDVTSYVCITRIIMRVILSKDLKYIFHKTTRYIGHGKYSKIPFFCGFGNLFVHTST